MTFEEMKQRAEALRAKRDKAVGAAEQIESNWLATYGTKDPQEIEKKLEEFKTQLGEVQKEYLDRMEEVEKLLAEAG